MEVYGREKKSKLKKRKYKSAAVVVESDSSGDDKKQKHPEKERQEVECIIYPGFSPGLSSEEEKLLQLMHTPDKNILKILTLMTKELLKAMNSG